jgi:hypothetical protein
MENSSGNSEQKETVVLPWDQSFAVRRGQFVYVSAQNKDDGGSIRCEILVNGTVVEQAESTGAYTIATCSGAVP